MTPKLSPLPEVTLTVNGSQVDAVTLRLLERVRVAQRFSSPAQCELTFGISTEASRIDPHLRPGAELTVTVSTNTTVLFAGEVTAIEYLYGPSNQRDVRVRAYDKLHRLRKRQTVRSFASKTVAAIARELCADLGMSVEAAEDGAEYQWLIQGRETDWQFLLRLAERSGLYLSARDAGRVLHLLTLEGAGAAISLALGSTLLEAHIEVNTDAAVNSVQAHGWFPTEGESFKSTVTNPRSGRTASALHTTAQADIGATIVDAIAQNEAHAGQLAQAELDQHAASEVTLWGVADGDPRLCPGTRIDVSGVGQDVSGHYVLTEATHTIDHRMGFVTEISTRPPIPAIARPVGTIATPGEVSSIDDPFQQGRVRVKLPTFNDVETDWMGVVVPGAGANKGVIALPNTGDLVLVLLAHEDPAHGVVLGGFYGQVSPPDVGIVNGERQRFTFVTPHGQRISMDDSNGTIHIENGSGSYIDLTPDRVRLHAAADLQIEAPGKKIAISAAAIDFNKA
jgi:phage protein D/phage baseplate assembly protein gpV